MQNIRDALDEERFLSLFSSFMLTAAAVFKQTQFRYAWLKTSFERGSARMWRFTA
jgi:hypothetical protein